MVRDETLYWSNDDGWGSMDTATRFSIEMFLIPPLSEAAAILELNDDGTVKECYLIGKGTPPPPVGNN